MPLPESAERLAALFTQPERWGQGGLIDALLEQVRQETGLDVKRADFKPDMLGTHLFMNLRVIDEHGRQLAQGRNIAALKAQWGSKARGAFQALASLKIASSAEDKAVSESKHPKNTNLKAQAAIEKDNSPGTAAPHAAGARHTSWDFGSLPELMEIQQG